jgi:hypothetical protein
MAGAGYRTFQLGEVLTSNNVQTYLMDQAVQVYAGTAQRGSAVPTPSAGMVAYSTATGLQVFDGSAWTDVGGVGYGAATGGASTATISVGGESYTLLTFTASGTLTVTKAGFFDYLLIGGGAGCAFKTSVSAVGGGGGSGQVTSGSIYLAANSTITIGAGSAPTNFTGAARIGGDTTLTVGAGYQTLNALGAVNKSVGADGAGDDIFVCTSSGAVASATNTRFINNALYGFKGGDANAGNSGGGGGGFGGAGVTGVNSTTGGVGGAGYDISVFIGGSTAFRATGGGGGGTGAGGAGGNSSACSNAGSTNTTPGSGAANTGAGGGAGVGTPSTGNGGSGVAYIRFR